VQHGAPVLWVAVDPAAPVERRVFRVVVTGGSDVGVADRYVGTIQMFDGSLVLHVFEVIPP
jgi:hypothetical protein